jgi:surface antigen
MRKLVTALALLPLSTFGSGALLQSDAGASTTYLCKSADYRCTVGGYNAMTAKRTGWAWRFYGGTWPSYNVYGPHNCTLYAAFRLENEGITLSWHASGRDWARVAAANGVRVDSTPSVGAIAQWDAGHVAYVEAVTPRGVVITDDNYSGAYTTKQLLTKSGNWPSHFLHFARRDGSAEAGDQVVRNPDLAKALTIVKPRPTR